MVPSRMGTATSRSTVKRTVSRIRRLLEDDRSVDERRVAGGVDRLERVGRAEDAVGEEEVELPPERGADDVGAVGVDGRAQARVARAGEQLAITVHLVAELQGVALRPGEVDADDPAVPVLLSLPHDDVVQLVVELAGQAEDEAGPDAVGEAGALQA